MIRKRNQREAKEKQPKKEEQAEKPIKRQRSQKGVKKGTTKETKQSNLPELSQSPEEKEQKEEEEKGIEERMQQMSHFQQMVYRATLLVPAGKITTYREIAAFIGRPLAARAVGNALRANPFAPTVPCHRVIPSPPKKALLLDSSPSASPSTLCRFVDVGGFMGDKKKGCSSVAKKIRLLQDEGLSFVAAPHDPDLLLLDLSHPEHLLFTFPSSQ